MDMSNDASLTYEEENAVCYMGGYVIHKLQNENVEVNFVISDKPDVKWLDEFDR